MASEFDRYYQALASKDARFDGRFFVGVMSTGIYSRPVCPARTPKAKNVKFFWCAAADLELLQALADDDRPITGRALVKMAQAWRPWRAYAALHLWRIRARKES